MRILIVLMIALSGCAHRPAAVSDARSPWRGYDRCSGAGQYRFVDDFTVALSTGKSLNSFVWMVLGHGPLEIEFVDPRPEIVATADGKVFRFEPSLLMRQEIDVSHPVHGIPKGMKTKWDFDERKLFYGKRKQPFFGPAYFEKHGEVKSARSLVTAVKGRRLSGAPSPGYFRETMDKGFTLDEGSHQELLIEIPAFRLNGENVGAQRVRFVAGQRSNTEPFDAMHCNGWEPRGIPYYFRRWIY